MRMLRFVPAMLLGFLFAGEVTLVTGPAYAYCCGCSCMYGCTCPGYWDWQYNMPCYYCRSTDHQTLQTSQLIDKDTKQFKAVSELTMVRQCFRDKVALSLLGQNRDALKFVPIPFNDKNLQYESLGRQVQSGKEM